MNGRAVKPGVQMRRPGRFTGVAGFGGDQECPPRPRVGRHRPVQQPDTAEFRLSEGKAVPDDLRVVMHRGRLVHQNAITAEYLSGQREELRGDETLRLPHRIGQVADDDIWRFGELGQ